MRSGKIQDFLIAFDSLLKPLAFKRRARSQEWRHATDDINIKWIHLNVGLHVINPSLGVSFPDLGALLPDVYSRTPGTMKVLSQMFIPPRIYSLDMTPDELVSDIRERGLPELDRLADRERVIRDLQSDQTQSWPTPSYSDRIRLLPLLLASMGRIAEARDIVREFSAEASGRDQLLPAYAAFAQAFEGRFKA